MTSKNPRDILGSRLKYISELVGSVGGLAKLMGVSRVQASRYLSGTSFPSAETLAKISKEMSIPLDWFFMDGDPEGDLHSLRFGSALASDFQGNSTPISDEYLPVGVYLYTKQLFSTEGHAEVALARVTKVNGIAKLKVHMTRPTLQMPDGHELLKLYGRCWHGILYRSCGHLGISTAEGPGHMAFAGLLEKKSYVGSRSAMTPFFVGSFHCPQVGENGGRRSTVNLILEKITENTTDVMAAGRKTGIRKISTLPAYLQGFLTT